MSNNIFIFILSLFLVIRGATLATRYAGHLAESFQLSKYAVGFLIVAVVGILPEAFISINSAIKGVPEFGLSVLFGSNIADLTLIFALIVLLSGRGIKVESKILKYNSVYPSLLLVPLVLGLDGHYARLEGAALFIAGAIFYYTAFKNGLDGSRSALQNGSFYKNSFFFLVWMVILLVGSHYTVVSASTLAGNLGVSPILVGMLIVGIGTTMPELFFSLKSAQKRDDALAVGDILGTVLADATIVVGILAMISPFSFPQNIVFITGTFMIIASLILFSFLRSGRTLSRKEAYMLLVLWVIFVLVEVIANS